MKPIITTYSHVHSESKYYNSMYLRIYLFNNKIISVIETY